MLVRKVAVVVYELLELNTKEAICIVKATCRRLIRAHINDCHRRINYANDKLLLCLSKLKELIPTSLLDTLTTIADKRANKTTEQHPHTRNATRPTKTGSGIFLSVP